jgi:hypothetical protein
MCYANISFKVLLLASVLLFSGFRHEFHSSLTQVQYNRVAQTLEVSIRMFTDDLEAAITKENNKSFHVDYPEADQMVTKYVLNHFKLQDTKNNKKQVNYVGKETDVDVTWVYLEIKVEGNVKLRLQNSLLMELYSDQTNIVNLKNGDNKRTYLFYPEEAEQEIAW